MAKVLVTGAAGFIGHHVTRLLLEQGHTVRALLRPGESDANLNGLEVEQVIGDVLDEERMLEVCRGCERVFHMAAVYVLWTPQPQRIWDVNVLGTMNVLNGCVAAGVERVVYTSSIAALGQRPGAQASDESIPFNLWNTGNDYIRSKYLSEQVALRYQRQLDIVAVNPAMPIGPGDIGPTPTGKLVLDFLRGDLPPVIFDGGVSLVDVEDVARGHVLAGEKGGRGERYVLSGHNTTLLEMLDVLQDITGIRRRFIKVPAAAAKVVAHATEWAANHVFHRHPLLTVAQVDFASQASFWDNRKAREQLGFTNRPLAESIQRATDWFRVNGYV
jgi:dihydroflavonol-4-reductase